MDRYRKAALGVLICAVGLGVSFLYVPAGLVIGFVGCVLAFGAVGQYNDPITRTLFHVGSAMYATSVYLGSREWLLVAATLAFPLLAAPTELAIRRLGFKFALLSPIALTISVVLLLAAWPPTWWWLAVVPILLMVGMFSREAMGLLTRLKHASHTSWKVQEGEAVPDFELPVRNEARPFRLSEQRGQHLLIQFVRGDWCPVCHVMMRLLKKDAARLEGRNVRVVAISPTEGDDADEFVKGLDLPYAVLCDPEHTIAKMFGAFDPAAFDGKGAPVAATFVVDGEGRLTFASRPDDLATFLDPQQVVRMLGAAPKG